MPEELEMTLVQCESATPSIVSFAIKRGIINPGSHGRDVELVTEIKAEIMS
jgi:hypothetical protein